MANGTIDLECGSTTNNVEREKQVSFAMTYFVIANRCVAKKSSNIKTLDDLKGKTIVSTAGTTNIKQLNEINADKNLGMNIISANDHPEAFLMVETGRAMAFVMDDILLYGPGRQLEATRPTSRSRREACRSSRTASCCARTIPSSRRSSTRR